MKIKVPHSLINIPQKPGVYIFKNMPGKIIYVGKAINLKSRVSSYFQKSSALSPEKQTMVGNIKKIEYIITTNETEALLLETSLIKKHQPPHNIMLKDDKYFLYIKITTNEDFPRVFTVRRVNKDKAKYFGPYTSALSVRDTLRLLRSLFPHRNFKSPASEKYVSKMHQRYPELLGPQDKDEYQKTIDRIVKFIKGDYEQIKKELLEKMHTYSKSKHYEKAARLRDKINAIEKISEKQKVVSTKLTNQDIISIYKNEDSSAINVFNIRLGKLLNKDGFILKNTSLKEPHEVIQEFIKQYYPKIINLPKEIILQYGIEDKELIEKIFKMKIIVPQKGKNKAFIKLGIENAKNYLEQQKASWEKESFNIKQSLEQLKKSLGLKKIPQRIETYDISNIQGSHAVGSMVVFTDGRPDKKWYRKFKIKTVQGANDPAMMAEILSRRFKHHADPPSPKGRELACRPAGRGEEEEKRTWPQPDLVILDGGKGQLNIVKKHIDTKIHIVALAKKYEEVYLPERKDPINLPINSPAYFLIQRMRDEAHRFAITFYRQFHKKENLKSSFDIIPGLGPKTKQKLIKQFGSMQAVRSATKKDLLKTINNKIANNILKYEK
ncbi:MAG: excinuclease ABC subunit UvrC [bacterium]|nr:excinuclease ABC subunit UvrC [bacterium]